MRVQRSGQFTLPAPVERVRPLFTAEGERAWAPGWDPEWADDDHAHEVGEVWTTTGPPATTWVTVETGTDLVRYARVAPGDSAGLVSVSCLPELEGTTVTVDYDLSALSAAGAERLAAFAASYDDMIEHWRVFTTRALTRRDRTRHVKP
jgi:hypothetical protein